MASLKDIIGVGWKFPFQFDGTGRVARQEEPIEKIRESLQQILGTFVGERVIRRDFGNLLFDLLLDPNDLALHAQIVQFVTAAIVNFEPRISVLNVSISDVNAEDGVVNVSVDYLIRRTQIRDNLVYPFYVQGEE